MNIPAKFGFVKRQSHKTEAIRYVVLRNTLVLLLITLLGGATAPVRAQGVPDGAAFLPEPAKFQTAPMAFVNDQIQYKWGKSQRNTPEGAQAATDMQHQVESYLSAFSSVVGIEMSRQATPNIYELFDYALRMGDRSVAATQATYTLLRPFTQYKESSLVPSLENTYSTTSSYPAVPAMMGWLYGLILTEVCPDRQDQVLLRGYQYGTSSVIAGFNWDSDSYAGRLLATALLSRFHAESSFNSMIANAKTEYNYKASAARTRAEGDGEGEGEGEPEPDEPDEPVVPATQPYVPTDELPSVLVYLPAPPDSVSARFACDIYDYQNGKTMRNPNTTVGGMALDDVEYSAENWTNVYSSLFGLEISASNTPEIYELIDRVHPTGNAATQEEKAYYMRLRPYVWFDEISGYPADDEGLRYTGSYPSGHASGSWLIAMILSEINPTAQEELLARAYQYGQGRVITGFHWQSDVDAGRLVASAAYACLHTSSDFQKQMLAAKNEYKTKTGTSIESVTNKDAVDANAPIYNLGGIRVDSPTQHGVYIQGNKKVVY